MTTYQSELLSKHLSETVKKCYSKADKADIQHMLVEGRIGTMELLGLNSQSEAKAA